MAEIDLHPDRIDNLQIGYPFEYLVMHFKEQDNEEAGYHFTPSKALPLQLANPPFGVEWKDQKSTIEKEHGTLGFAGSFSAGIPAISGTCSELP